MASSPSSSFYRKECLRKERKTTLPGSGLFQAALSVYITTARDKKGNIYLCHPSKVKESKQQSSKLTLIFPSLLNPQASKHFHFLERETRKMTMLWVCIQAGADFKLDCQNQRMALSTQAEGMT